MQKTHFGLAVSIATILMFSVFVPIAFAEEGRSEADLGPLIKATKHKLPPKYHVSQSKVCGIELCGRNSNNTEFAVEVSPLGYNDAKKQSSFNKAMENPLSLSILRDYYLYKQNEHKTVVPIPQLDAPVNITLSRPTDNPFANPNYSNVTSVEPIVKLTELEEEATPYVVQLPPWIKGTGSYANPDFPVYKKKGLIEPVVAPVVELVANVTEPVNATIIQTETIVPETPVPIVPITCGAGTELIDNVCVAIVAAHPVEQPVVEEPVVVEPVPVPPVEQPVEQPPVEQPPVEEPIREPAPEEMPGPHNPRLG